MRIRTLHPWTVSPQEAMAIQLQLRSQLRLYGTGPFGAIAGVDVAYDKSSKRMFAGAVVMSGDGREVLDFATATASADFPYIPGLLSFREIPAVIKAWKRLKTSADCLICDGHGLAHPRRFGLACHLGLLLDLPSIGCAKSRLVGTYREPRKCRGSAAPLLDQDEQIGVVLRTKDGVAPVFVSQGDRVDLDAAVQAVLAICRGYRLPEPQRRAHLLVTKMRLAAGAGSAPGDHA
ncbi:MAG: deoxyribonuclease V [candidate division NC10 bacterium]|nr:deoxyribonuclease V [candidate division NC10 bacterium]